MDLKQYTKEFGYNLRLATPIILSMLGHTLVGFIDNIMVGKIGPKELAAVSLGNSIIFLAMSFGIGFSTAITALTAEAHGGKNSQESKSVLGHGLLLCVLLSFLLVGLLLPSHWVMTVTKQDPEVIALAVPYVHLVATSFIPMMIFQAFKQFSDGFSLTKYAMYVTFIGNIINIVLNFLFIYGMFGFPKWGVMGAAVGTFVSRIVMPILLWYFLVKNEETSSYVRGFNWRRIQYSTIKKLISIGVPSSLQMVFEAGIFIVATWISGALGSNYQASHQIALSLSSMTFMVSNGMSAVAMIRISNFKGMGDFIGFRRVAISIFMFVLGNQVLMAVIFALFHQQLPSLFLDTNDLQNINDIQFVINDAAVLLIIAGLFQIPDGLQVVALGALRGLQDVKIPMFLCFISYWLIAFPFSYYLGLYTDLQNQGIWIGLCIGLALASLFLVIRFFSVVKKQMKSQVILNTDIE